MDGPTRGDASSLPASLTDPLQTAPTTGTEASVAMKGVQEAGGAHTEAGGAGPSHLAAPAIEQGAQAAGAWEDRACKKIKRTYNEGAMAREQMNKARDLPAPKPRKAPAPTPKPKMTAYLMSSLVAMLHATAVAQVQAGTRPMLNLACFFSGMGSEAVAFFKTGLVNVVQVVEKLAAGVKVTNKHIPGLNAEPTDVTAKGLEIDPEADIVTCTWPCTDISPMGNREGLDGEDSGLIKVFMQLVQKRVDAGNPVPILYFENVPNMLNTMSTGDVPVEALLRMLKTAGYCDVAWRTTAAGLAGYPTARERVITVACYGTGDCASAILAEGLQACTERGCTCHEMASAQPRDAQTMILDMANARTKPVWRTTLPVTTTGNVDCLCVLERPTEANGAYRLYRIMHDILLRLHGYDSDYLDILGLTHASIMLANMLPLIISGYYAYILTLFVIEKRGTRRVRVTMPEGLRFRLPKNARISKTVVAGQDYPPAGMVTSDGTVGFPEGSAYPFCEPAQTLASFLDEDEKSVLPDMTTLSRYLIRLGIAHRRPDQDPALDIHEMLQTIPGVQLSPWVDRQLRGKAAPALMPGTVCWLQQTQEGPPVAVIWLPAKQGTSRAAKGTQKVIVRRFPHIYIETADEVVRQDQLVPFTSYTESQAFHSPGVESSPEERARVTAAEEAYEAQDQLVQTNLCNLLEAMGVDKSFHKFCVVSLGLRGGEVVPADQDYCGFCRPCQSNPGSRDRCLARRAYDALCSELVPGALLSALGPYCVGARLRVAYSDGRQYHAYVRDYQKLTMEHQLVFEDGETKLNAMWTVQNQDFQFLSCPHQWVHEARLQRRVRVSQTPAPTQPVTDVRLRRLDHTSKEDQRMRREERDGAVRLAMREPGAVAYHTPDMITTLANTDLAALDQNVIVQAVNRARAAPPESDLATLAAGMIKLKLNM